MTALSIIARLPVLPAKRAELFALLNKAISAAEHETGLSQYVIHQDAKNDDVIWFYESYVDRTDLDSHLSSGILQEIIAAIPSMLSGRAEMNYVTPIGGKGLGFVR